MEPESEFDALIHIEFQELLGRLIRAHEREVSIGKFSAVAGHKGEGRAMDQETSLPGRAGLSKLQHDREVQLASPAMSKAPSRGGSHHAMAIVPSITIPEASEVLAPRAVSESAQSPFTNATVQSPFPKDIADVTDVGNDLPTPSEQQAGKKPFGTTTWTTTWSQAILKLGTAEKKKRFEDVLNDFEVARERRQRGHGDDEWCLEKLVRDPRFEVVFSVFILVNSFTFALQTQIEGWDMGSRRGFTRSEYIYSDKQEWASLLHVLEAIGNVMGVLFCLEVAAKVVGLGVQSFARSFWNWFDSIIVASWLLADITSFAGMPLEPRALHSLRLVRLLRILRLLRTIQLFDSLYLLNAAFKGSIGVLTWSLVYISVVQITIALVLSEGIHQFYLRGNAGTESDHKEVYDYFGTASRATLTMFEMTLANWPPVCRVMVDHLGEWWVCFALLHKLTMGFAFIGIFNGVVLQETFKAAAQDSNVMVRDRQRAKDKLSSSLRTVFASADADLGGTLDLEEFVKMCNDPILQMWLSSLGLTTRDATKVFHLIDNGDGKLTADELVEGVERFRGVASGIDLHISVEDLMHTMRRGFEEQRQRYRNLTQWVAQMNNEHAAEKMSRRKTNFKDPYTKIEV